MKPREQSLFSPGLAGWLVVCGLLVVGGPPQAAYGGEGQSIEIEQALFPPDAHHWVEVTVPRDMEVSWIRLYFKQSDLTSYYFSLMWPFPESPGRYWVILPKPEKDCLSVTYYAAAGTKDGSVVKVSHLVTAPVDKDYPRKRFSEEQARVARNLIIGETIPAQENKRISGFQCDHVTDRITAKEVLKPDGVCRAIGLAVPLSNVLGLLAMGGIAVVTENDPPASPSIP